MSGITIKKKKKEVQLMDQEGKKGVEKLSCKGEIASERTKEKI